MAITDKVNILLVDDQPARLLTYETILADLGENLIKASSGEEALQHLLKTEVAVVLVDVVMPNIDGFELAQLIRSHPRCQRTAIIFVSGVQITNLDQLKGYESGAVDYISVPIVPELLRARVMVFADLYRKTAALEQMNRELEVRVMERTAELERDLTQRKRLEEALLEADHRKDEFLAILAHELRNPLAPIRTAVDIMRMLKLQDPMLLQCTDIIDRQITQLTRLVDDLMDVSRITHGRFTLNREKVRLVDIIRRAVETHHPLINKRGHHLKVELGDESIILDGDPVRLSEAVANLVCNAAKYTGDGGDIILECVVSPGQKEVEIRVHDNGIGIPAEMLERVFEPFTQLDRNMQRSQGGLGIGLALVRKLAEMHGGSVEAFSDGVGRGSKFVLRLPLPEQTSTPLIRGEKVVPLVESKRILVVDDNRDSAEALAVMLRLDGAQVETSFDGPQALSLAETFRPEMILLDLGMPGMNGLEVARAVRSKPWGADVVLVAQTGWGQEKDRHITADAGFDEHLTKPVDRATLLKLLAVRHQPTPPPTTPQARTG